MRKLSIETIGTDNWVESTKEVTLSRTKDDGTVQSRTDIHNIASKEISLRIIGAEYDDDDGVDNFITISAEANFERLAAANKIVITTKGDQLSPEMNKVEYYESFEALKAAWTATVNAITFGLEHTISRQMIYGETYRRDSLRTLKG